jgi:hypothetical protein
MLVIAGLVIASAAAANRVRELLYSVEGATMGYVKAALVITVPPPMLYIPRHNRGVPSAPTDASICPSGLKTKAWT